MVDKERQEAPDGSRRQYRLRKSVEEGGCVVVVGIRKCPLQSGSRRGLASLAEDLETFRGKGVLT